MRSLKRSTTRVRRDPAPSRLLYRWQRIWLTPMYRRLIAIGLPVAALVAGGHLVLRDPDVQAQITASLVRARDSVERRPEFQVQLLHVQDVPEELAAEVRKAAGIDLPVSSFRLDLEEVRKRIETLHAVKQASLFLRAGGVLEVVIEQRVPAVIWRGPERLQLLDADGELVAYIDHRRDHPDLPLLAGTAAGRHIAEAQKILDAARPVADRIRGLIRVGDRRWDIVLDRDQRILLPAEDAVRAVEHVMAMQMTQDVLSRDISVMDMRDTRRPILRLSQAALEERRLRQAITNNVDHDL
jgi:cell division protein FtsQ